MYQADYLTSTGREIPDSPSKMTFLGAAEPAFRLGVVKSWFADLGFRASDSILGLFLLNNRHHVLRL